MIWPLRSFQCHENLLAHKRALLYSLLEEAGVTDVEVEFPPSNSNSDKCTISGPEQMVMTAKTRLQNATERQLGGCTEELKAKPEHHKFLIGRQGANIRKVREKTNARIIFPAEDSADRETIIILGPEAAVKVGEFLICKLSHIYSYILPYGFRHMSTHIPC